MGLEEGLDVSIYAKPEYNEWQMEQIRLGLKDHIDVGVYSFITIPAATTFAINNPIQNAGEAINMILVLDNK